MLSRHVVMIDLETAGTEVNSPIIQIGAVVWDLHEGKMIDSFNEIISLKSSVEAFGRHIGIDTLGWWLKRRTDLLQASIEANSSTQSFAAVMTRFNNWLYPHITKYPSLDFLCYGASFDFPMLTAAFKATGLRDPIHYRRQQCLRTIFHINDFDLTEYHAGKEATHDGLEDCLRQLAGLQYLVDMNKVKISVS